MRQGTAREGIVFVPPGRYTFTRTIYVWPGGRLVGRYAILTEKTSPAWQFTLIDSTFDGQHESAIREHEAGLTLIRDAFRNVPTAIDLDPGYPDQLWVKDSRFENITGAAVVISLEQSPLTEIGFENAILSNAVTFAKLRESGKTIPGGGTLYQVKTFNYGLIIPGEGRMSRKTSPTT